MSKKVIITGSSKGMGYEITKKFLFNGYEVHGIDVLPCDIKSESYFHYICDISKDDLPDIEGCNILINNAGIQTVTSDMKGSREDMEVNFFGLMRCTEKYALENPQIQSVLNQASTSAINGSEFAVYAASKAAVVNYTIWTSHRVAKYGATCNSLSVGGVDTALNDPVMKNKDCWEKIMMLTPLQKWAQAEEIAEWVYFLTVTNKSCSGQNIVIDNGESKPDTFVYPI